MLEANLHQAVLGRWMNPPLRILDYLVRLLTVWARNGTEMLCFSGSSVDPDLTGATGNNAIMEKKGDASQKDSTGGFLEYSLVIDSKSERRLHHLIPVQPLQVTPSARKPECDICLCKSFTTPAIQPYYYLR